MGPNRSWSVTLFSLCCSALGLQVSPPMESTRNPGWSAQETPILLIPVVTIAYWMPAVGWGFKSVRGGASESWSPPPWICGSCWHGTACPSIELTPLQSDQKRRDRAWMPSLHLHSVVSSLFLGKCLECPSYAVHGSWLSSSHQRELWKVYPVSTFTPLYGFLLCMRK